MKKVPTLVFLLVIFGSIGADHHPDHSTPKVFDVYAALEGELAAIVGDTSWVGKEIPKPAGNWKIGDTCPQCNGTGRSGDGLSKCGLCKGSKDLDTEEKVNKANQAYPEGPDEDAGRAPEEKGQAPTKAPPVKKITLHNCSSGCPIHFPAKEPTPKLPPTKQSSTADPAEEPVQNTRRRVFRRGRLFQR